MHTYLEECVIVVLIDEVWVQGHEVDNFSWDKQGT